MSNDPNAEQAQVLLDALEIHISRLSALIEKSERQRGGRFITDTEKSLRRDLSEAHGHVRRLCERFPQTRSTGR